MVSIVVSFQEACEKAGGEYTFEYGPVEPDVGIPHGIPARETKKEWCTIEGENVEVTIFHAPQRKHLSIDLRRKGDYAWHARHAHVEYDSRRGFHIDPMGEFGPPGICFSLPDGSFPRTCVNSPEGGIKDPYLWITILE
jgi:hypothetical protein